VTSGGLNADTACTRMGWQTGLLMGDDPMTFWLVPLIVNSKVSVSPALRLSPCAKIRSFAQLSTNTDLLWPPILATEGVQTFLNPHRLGIVADSLPGMVVVIRLRV
jgi:hypothetical protein